MGVETVGSNSSGSQVDDLKLKMDKKGARLLRRSPSSIFEALVLVAKIVANVRVSVRGLCASFRDTKEDSQDGEF